MRFYEMLAPVYDSLNRDVDYQKMADYIKNAVGKYSLVAPEIFLDAGCGTGSLTVLLAAAYQTLIGADASADMLMIAQNKAQQAQKDILFLCQELTKLDLYGTVDGAVCSMDTLNHLPDAAHFAAALERISLFLMPGGLLIFDLNTPYKHREILGNHTVVKESDEAFCVWENRLHPVSGRVEMQINLFTPEDEELYLRENATQSERLILLEELTAALAKAQLELLAETDGYTDLPVTGKTQRIVYITRKIKN